MYTRRNYLKIASSGVVLSGGCLVAPHAEQRLRNVETDENASYVWRHFHDRKEGEAVFYSDGTVYSVYKSGNLVAADAADGRFDWSVQHHPSLCRDVYVSGDIAYTAGLSIGVVASSVHDGEKYWEHNHHSGLVWEVHEANGRLYSAGRDAKVIAADATDGSLLWEHNHHEADGNPSNEMIRSLFFADGLIFSAGFDGRVIAADAVDGTKVWEYDHGNWLKSVHAVDEMVYLSIFRDDYRGDVAGIDMTTNKRIWEHAHHNQIGDNWGVEEIYVTDGIVYSAGDDGKLIACEASNGEFLWEHEYHENSVRSVHASRDSIFTTSRDSSVIKVPIGKQ